MTSAKDDDGTPRLPRRRPIWNRKDVPHRDWADEGTWDSHEDPAWDPDDIITCEMCGQTGLRYVRFLTHPEYEGTISVGRKCAASMLRPSIKRTGDDLTRLQMLGLADG